MIYYSTSEIGKRSNNEDSISCKEYGDTLCIMLADGLGGCSDSEIASNIAVSMMVGFLEENKDAIEKFAEKEFEGIFSNAFQKINNEIAIKASNSKTDMSTTLSVVLINARKVFIAHIGDCRTYLLHGSKLEQLTKDHTYAADLVREGKMSEDNLYTDSRRNVLTKYLGENCFVTPDFYRYNIMYGDLILLCTDGLYVHLSDIELKELLRVHASLEQCASSLIKAVYSNGASDNVSLILAHNKPVK